ncbi:hypothetical protein, partial [Propionivibrio sp.]|uniref:hypothetical protein n=1 Tax=Propionivibrio sp. TaxID=2212460 RepID=UPI003BF2965A
LFLDLFDSNVAANAFDANVLGSAHLGSLDLVRKSVNMDGLALLQGDREEAATRYLYRAWKSTDVQGRGLHFLRTYLQMMFPNLCEVEQLWQDKSQPYPTALFTGKPRVSFWLYALGEPGLKLNGRWKVGGQRPVEDFATESSRFPDLSGMFLTSRIEIALDFSVQVTSVASLMHIIRSVIPARLLPLFRFMLRFMLYVQARLSAQLLMEKKTRIRYPWCGLVISDSDDIRWSLGRDGALVTLPLPFGTFKVGEKRGGMSVWRLRNCRVSSSSTLQKTASASVYRLPKLSETGRRLDSTWKVGGYGADTDSSANIYISARMDSPQDLIVTHHEYARMDYPATPSKLASFARLSGWRRLDGQWGIGATASRRPFGFSLRRNSAIEVDSSAVFYSSSDTFVTPERLTRVTSTKLAPVTRKVDGGWAIGAENKIGRFHIDGRRLRARKMTICPRIGGFKVAYEYPDIVFDQNSSRTLTLNGSWRIGGPAAPMFSFRSIRS